MFGGGRRFPERELEEAFQCWAWAFPVFMDCIDREKGDWLHLPAPGSLYEQPHMLMSVMRVLRSVFVEEIRKEWERKAKQGR